MKVYELMKELERLPAGCEVHFGRVTTLDEIKEKYDCQDGDYYIDEEIKEVNTDSIVTVDDIVILGD